MKRRLLPRIAATAAAVATTAALPLLQPQPAAANSDRGSTLAVLLDGLDARLTSLYDGVRFVRINAPGGRTLTVTISCERQQWRVLRIDPALKGASDGRPGFRNESFQPAPGIRASHWCTAPVRIAD